MARLVCTIPRVGDKVYLVHKPQQIGIVASVPYHRGTAQSTIGVQWPYDPRPCPEYAGYIRIVGVTYHPYLV